jgi:hypothetical protein
MNREERKIVSAAWAKLTPARQKQILRQIDVCNTATKAAKQAMRQLACVERDYERLATREDRAYTRLEKLFGVKKGSLGGL